MEKNEVYELEIIDNGTSFEGIAKIDNKVVFIPGAIIGEKVLARIIKVNKDYAIGKIEEIIVKSPYRQNAICDVFKRCGGCSAQHICYNTQLFLKNKLVANVLRKQKIDTGVLDTSTIGMGMPYYYRNKAQYPVRYENGKTVMGFYAKRSHQIIENDCCFIQNRVIDILAKEVFDLLLKYDFVGYDESTLNGDIRHILIRRGLHTGNIMIVIIVNKNQLLEDKRFITLVNELTKNNRNIKSVYLNLNDKSTNEILGEQEVKIYGNNYICDYIGDYNFCISPKSFFQVNTLQAEVLYEILKENLSLSGDEVIFDLYSGVGSIGIYLSDKVKYIYGIEIEKQAVEMANINLKLNDIENAEYIAGSVEDKIEEFNNRNITPDVIVVDPPRKGLDEKSIEYILNFNSKKIGYVSCNPATLARDLKILSCKYDIWRVIPVDLFPNTEHIECIAILNLKKTM